MNKVCKIVFVLILCLCAFCSCSRNEIEVNDLQTQVYVTTSGKMGFTFYANGIFSADNGNSVIITSPDGNFEWKSPIASIELGKVVYYGSSNFMMPEGVALQKGMYDYTIVCKDGRTIEHAFGLTYEDVEGALERAKNESLPYFDSASNITVVRD